MTNPFSPVSPPPELVQQWIGEIWHEGAPVRVAQSDLHLAARAAQWGADQELEACIAWFDKSIPGYELVADRIRAARRPKPLSLKERLSKAIVEGDERQALKLLEELDDSL